MDFIKTLLVLRQLIGAGGMCGEQLGTLAIELEVLVVANINFCEVILVEVAALEDITT